MSLRPPTVLELPAYLAGQVSRFGRRYLAEVLAEHDLLLAPAHTIDDGQAPAV